MDRVHSINQRLRELDLGLAQRRIDRERYRFLRRALIDEFEEQTAESGDATAPEGAEPVRADPSSANPVRETPLPPAGMAAGAAALESGSSLRLGRIAGIVVGTLVVCAAIAGGWWALAPKTETVTPAPAGGNGPVMPQDLVKQLMESPWTEPDLRQFIDQWNRLPPASLAAAQDDPRMWLLRQEIEQRLRNAEEAVSLDASERNLSRVKLLEQVHDTIRPGP